MDSQDNRIDQILMYLAKAATTAAGGVNDAVQCAGAAMGEKYGNLKAKMDLERLHCEQDKAFRDLGQTYFSMKTGGCACAQAGENCEDVLDKLLTLCIDKQTQIDEIGDILKREADSVQCPSCNNKTDSNHTYCYSCGAKLTNDENPPSDEPAEKTESASS